MEELIERHKRFWTREVVQKPLIGFSRQGTFFLEPFIMLGIEDGIIQPENFPDPNAFIHIYYERMLGECFLDGDSFGL